MTSSTNDKAARAVLEYMVLQGQLISVKSSIKREDQGWNWSVVAEPLKALGLIFSLIKKWG